MASSLKIARPPRAPASSPPDAGDPAVCKVSIRDLGFFYGAAAALKGVSLDVPERQVMGLIGPSGCGKSTLLRVLNRLYDRYPDERATGEVWLDGRDILRADVDRRWLRRRVGMVFQESTVFPMSVRDNIAFAIGVHEHLSSLDLHARIEGLLTRVDLWAEVKDRLSGPADALSGGQQQRLCIARALATRPEVLLLDEPTSALDPVSTARIERLIGELKAELTIVFVTHDMQQAARCADQVAFLYLGELVETGAAERIFHAPTQRRTQDFVAGHFG